MDRFSKMLFTLIFVLFSWNVAAQVTPTTPMGGMQIKKATPSGNMAAPANPSPTAPRTMQAIPSAIAPAGIVANPPVDTEALVQAEIKRLQKKRDDISNALAKVGSNYSKLTYTPDTGNACLNDDLTWNSRSGESFTCVGQTTCIGRASRWSKSRSNPCEPGVAIDSCVVTDECKKGTVCNTAIKKCVHPG